MPYLSPPFSISANNTALQYTTADVQTNQTGHCTRTQTPRYEGYLVYIYIYTFVSLRLSNRQSPFAAAASFKSSRLISISISMVVVVGVAAVVVSVIVFRAAAAALLRRAHAVLIVRLGKVRRCGLQLQVVLLRLPPNSGATAVQQRCNSSNSYSKGGSGWGVTFKCMSCRFLGGKPTGITFDP